MKNLEHTFNIISWAGLSLAGLYLLATSLRAFASNPALFAGVGIALAGITAGSLVGLIKNIKTSNK